MSRIIQKIKKKLKKNVFKNFLTGMGGTLVSVALRMATISLITKSISIEAFGRYNTVFIFSNFVLLFLDIKLENLVFRFMGRFRSEGQSLKVAGMFWTAVLGAAAIGSVAALAVYLCAETIATKVYADPGLASLFKIYCWVLFFSIFTAFSNAILRLFDAFKWAVLPQLLGTATTFALVCGSYFGGFELTIKNAILFESIGLVMGDIPALMMSAIILNKAGFSLRNPRAAILSLKENAAEIKKLAWQGNLTGYLKLGAERGAMMILSFFGTPTQVAYLSTAKIFVRPILLLQRNVNSAISPEVHRLFSEKKYDELYRFLGKFQTTGMIASGVLLAGMIVIFPFVSGVLFTPKYDPAKYAMAFQLGIVLLNISLGPVNQLTIAMDRLHERNLLLAIQLVFICALVPFFPQATVVSAILFSASLFNSFTIDRRNRRQLLELIEVNKKGESQID